MRDGKHSDGFINKAAEEALTLARADGNEEEEAEVLLVLVLTSSERHGQAQRQHYFEQAEKKVDCLKSTASKVIYFRVRAATLSQSRAVAEAEEAYRTALTLCGGPEDEKGNLARQGCIVRSSLVHLLCNEKRLD